MNFIPSADYAARHPERFPDYVPPKPRPDYESLLRTVTEHHAEMDGDGYIVIGMDQEFWEEIRAAVK